MTFGPPSGAISGLDTLSYLNQNEALFIKKVIAQRAPTANDKRGHAYGDIWVDQATDTVYLFANVTAGSADWVAVAGGSSDIDTVHTDSGDVTPSGAAITIAGTAAQIATAGSGSTVTISIPSTFSIGSVSGSAGGTISVGTGNFSLATAITSTIDIGSVGQSGTITLGKSTTGQAINIGTAAGPNLISIGSTNGAAAMTLRVGSGNFSLDGAAASTYSIGPSTTTGTMNFGGTGANTGVMTIAGGTGAQTVNIANSTGGKTVAIATGAGINAVTVGSTNTSSITTINSGSGGLVLAAPAATGVSLGSGGPKLLVGSGSPSGSVTAPTGSLYLNTAGSTTNDRAYINTNGTTGWTAVTTAT